MLDQELLEKLKEDINEGAALLLKEYSGFVWWVCSQRLSNPEDIRECVNQVFAEFCLKIESYDPGKSALKTYLCMIAERKSVDYLRKESIRHKIIVDEKEVDLLGAHEIEEEIISHADLEAALAQLNPDDEKIIRMNYYEGRSFQEIASELNFPYETIKKRNQRILKKLLKFLVFVTVIAALTGCAATIYRYYQVTGNGSFNYLKKKPIYQLDEITEGITRGRFRIQVENAVCWEDTLTLELVISSRDLDMPNLAEALSLLEGITSEATTILEGKAIRTDNYCIPKEDTWIVLMTYTLTEQLKGDNFFVPLDFRFSQAQDYSWASDMLREDEWDYYNYPVSLELHFSKAKEMAVEKEAIKSYPNGRFLLRVSNMAEDYTILSLYQAVSNQGYSIASGILNNRTQCLTEGRICVKQEKTEKEYPILAVFGMDAGVPQQIQCLVDQLPAGCYMLQIPYLCLEGTGATDEITLSVGDEKGAEAALPNGASYMIDSISYERMEQSYMEEKDGEFNTTSAYFYRLYGNVVMSGTDDYELLGGNCNGMVTFRSGKTERVGGMIDWNEQKLMMMLTDHSVDASDDMPVSITLSFRDPIYRYQKKYEIPFEIIEK